MAVILITGATGQLGNELRIASFNYPGYEFIFSDADTLDLTDGVEVKKFISDTQPDWIINCAAYNFVEKAESEFEMARKVNGNAVKNLTDALYGKDCRLIHISTDYVFDGASNTPYTEGSEPNPLSAYARSKYEGERNAILHYGTMIIRTSWLYSSFGTNFLKTILSKGAEKEKLQVVFDQTGTPTYAADLAEAILLIISRAIRNQVTYVPGIYHYSNEGVCSWFDFATEIVNEAGLECSVIPVLSSAFPSAVRRPSYSVLHKGKIKETYGIEIPHWRKSVKKCVRLLLLQ